MSSSVLTKRASNRDSADPLRTSHEQSCFNFDLGFDFANFAFFFSAIFFFESTTSSFTLSLLSLSLSLSELLLSLSAVISLELNRSVKLHSE